MKKRLFGGAFVVLCSFAGLAAASPLLTQVEKMDAALKRMARDGMREKRNTDLVQNGDFAKGREAWQLHECKFQENAVVFANTTHVYSQLWQKRRIPLAAGTRLRLEVEASVHDPEGLLKTGGNLAQYKVLFLDEFGKKPRYAPGEEGRAGRFTDTKGERKTFTVDYKVPDGVGMIQPTLALNLPIQLKIHAIRAWAELSGADAEKWGIAVPRSALPKEAVAIPRPDGVTVAPVAYPVTISMTGSLKEWESVPEGGRCRNPLPAFLPPEPGGRDVDGGFKLAMDAENLYVLAIVRDDEPRFREYGDFKDDSVELFFSPLFRRQERNGATDFHITVAPENRELDSFHLTGSGYRNHFRPRVKGIPMPDGWAVEVAIPLKNSLFEMDPYNGCVFGFNMQINDNDSGKRDHKVSWMPDPGEQSWCRPDVLGAALVRTAGTEPVRPARAAAERMREKEEPFRFVNREPGTINVLRNGDFEQGEIGWTDWYGVDGSFMKILPEAAAHGRFGAVIDARVLEKDSYGSSLNSHSFQVIPGEKYRLSFLAKNESGLPVSFEVTYKSQDYRITCIPVKCALAARQDWTQFQGEFVVPEKYDRENSVVQLMIRGRSGGRRVLFDDFKLVRFNPGETDADLGFAATGNAFVPEKAEPALLRLENAGSEREEYELEISFHDFLRGNRRLETRPVTRIALAAGEAKTVEIPVRKERFGLFQLRVKLVNRKDGSAMLRRTEYAIHHPSSAPAGYAGVCVGHHHLRPSIAALLDGCVAAGISSLRTFVDRKQEYAPGKFDFRTLDIFTEEAARRRLDVIACLNVMSRSSGKATDDLEEYGVYLRAFAEHYKGKIPYYEMGNEPNLPMGWPPKSSVEEYAMFLRAAFCTIRSIDPDAKIMNAGVSQAALDDFTRRLLAVNAGNFYDIFAFHPYDFEASAGYRKGFEETIRTVDSYRGGTVIFDTESNTQNSDGFPAVTKISKRIPFYIYLGIARHHNWAFDRMSSGHLYSYFSSPGAGYPAYAWITSFYPDGCRSIGGLDGKGDFECYAAELPSGEIRAAVWRTYPGSRSVFRFPAAAETRVFDAFGNDVTATQKRSGGVIELNPEPELPLFIAGCPALDSLKLRKFVRDGRAKAPAVSLDTLLLPRKLNGFFERHIPGGSEQKLDLYVKNYSSEPREVELKALSEPAGMEAAFEPARMTLAAGEIRSCVLKVRAPAEGGYVLHCGGAAGGLPLADVPVTFTVTGDFDAAIRGRHLAVANHGGEERICDFNLSGQMLDVTPFQKKEFRVPAGDTVRFALKPEPRRRGARLPEDGRFPVEIQLAAAGKTYQMSSFFEIAEAMRGAPGASEEAWYPAWGNCPPLILKGTSGEIAEAALRFRWEPGRLYVAGRVKDPSFAPEGKVGYLTGGDSVVVGIDPGASAEGPGYGPGIFEAGFAAAADGSVESYCWDGSFGLEAAKPFPDAQAKFFRRETGYDFNLAIPFSDGAVKNSRIGLGVLIVNKDAEGKRELLRFGAGLEKQKDASRFGTLLLD